MSEQKKKPQEPTAEVDWAERLKAAMNESPAEHTDYVPTSEEDDLAALLRAQLSHRGETDHVDYMDLDTEDFEEELEDELKEEPEDTNEETENDVPISESDSSDTEYISPREVEDLPWDDDDSTVDESNEVDEIIPDELPEPIAVTVYSADLPSHGFGERISIEDDTAEQFDVEDSEQDESAELGYRTDPPALTEKFTYLSPDGDVGDLRLQAADAESTLLLKEEGVLEEEEEDEEPHRLFDVAEDDMDGKPFVGERTVEGKKSHPATVIHPMQMGLDDVVSVVETLPPLETPPPRRISSASDYTARMHRETKETMVKDTDLYLQLGYEDRLTRSEEQAAVEEARRRAHERDAVVSREASPTRNRREFTDRSQTPAIDRAYTRASRLYAVRLCVAAVGALFGILYSLYGVLCAPVGAVTFTDSALYPLLGVLWTVSVCILFLPRLVQGIGSLVAFEPTRYAVATLGILGALINDCIAIFSHGYHLFGGAALLMLAVAALSEYLANEGERTAFLVVSAGKPSFVLTDETTPASAENGEKAPDESTLTATRTGRLADYFARTGKYNPYAGRLNYLLPVAMLCAILCAGIAVLTGMNTVGSVAPVFTAAYLICLPSAYLLAMNLPLCVANRLLRKKGTAVVGAAAPADYAGKGSTRLLFRDGDALGGLHRKEITLRDDPDTALYRRKAAKLFRLMECPLWNESPLGEDDTTGLCLEIAESGEGFVRLYMVDLIRNETVEVMMGSHADLSRRGIRLPKLAMEKTYKKTENSRIIYLAFDGQFRLAYSVEYRVGKTFTRAVQKLASLGDTASLSTYDPMVDASILDVSALKGQPPVDILRPTYVERVRASRSGGVIATGRSLDLLYPYTACRRMKSVYRFAHLACWISLLLGVGLTALLVALGCGIYLSAAVVTAWQLLLSAVMVAAVLIRINRKTLFLKPDKEKATPQNADQRNTKH